jgi:hypothetical protein
VAIVDEGCKLVLLHDRGVIYFDWYSYVLVLLHGSVQIKAFGVDLHELCVYSEQNAV